MIEFLKKLTLAESPSTDPASQKKVMVMLKTELQYLDYQSLISKGHKTGGF